jgi:hypothetical protein
MVKIIIILDQFYFSYSFSGCLPERNQSYTLNTLAGNTNYRGGLGTVDLLIKVANLRFRKQLV